MHHIIENFDISKKISMPGKDLMEKGLPIAIADQAGAVVIVYKKMIKHGDTEARRGICYENRLGKTKYASTRQILRISH
jgi:hypothetical protein